jgi:outer membrane protein TolC
VILLVLPVAHALTLDAAVRRAAEVDPDAVVAELEWKRSRLDATEAWASLGVTPSLELAHTWSGGATSDANQLSVSLGVLDPPAWLGAGKQAAQARSKRYDADATVLDAQYATASLYYEALAADAALASAQEGARYAQATTDATAARVTAGLESELAGRSARLGLLQAQADVANAEADVAIARSRLARALQQDIDTLEPAPPLDLPGDSITSPAIAAAKETVAAAKLERAESIASIFPTGTIVAASALPAVDEWALTLGMKWTFDGVAGPFLAARDAALAEKITEIRLDALERDIDLGLSTAREQARAAGLVAEAARARQALADESLGVGQTRLSVGLASSLEVLRLQDEAVKARGDRVAAELREAEARLEARRLAGVAW